MRLMHRSRPALYQRTFEKRNVIESSSSYHLGKLPLPLPQNRRDSKTFNPPLIERDDKYTADPRPGVATGEDPVAAICVQEVDVQGVLQFTLIHTVGCALHRHTSRVIHRSKLFTLGDLKNSRCTFLSFSRTRGGPPSDQPNQEKIHG